MNGNELKNYIRNYIVSFVEDYPAKNGMERIWRTPLVGYADVNLPFVRNLKEIVTEVHMMPEDVLENPKVVISYFIPFTKDLERTNVGVEDNKASVQWADAYKATNKMMGELSAHLAEELNKMGYRAAVPTGKGMLYDELKSDWSQRHMAYAAGLGTFGINNMLITREGCCGRYHSIVADIPVEADAPLQEENCLYKSKGLCKKCVSNCFSGALTTEGFDRFKCFEACEKNMAIYGVDICGKCVTDIPCAFGVPGVK